MRASLDPLGLYEGFPEETQELTQILNDVLLRPDHWKAKISSRLEFQYKGDSARIKP